MLVPGVDFFEKLREKIGGLPFIAEDLGLVTPEVQALRDRFELPGMRVLEFAFGGDAHDYQPHRYPRRTVVYTGTHDNDTLIGWLGGAERTLDPAERARLEGERKRALAYAGSDGREPHWDFIRLALSSVANTALFPLQDVLGQGTESRMNVPGTAFGNWTYRCKAEDLSASVSERLGTLCATYERIPRGLKGW
jgi:4-alpha-glucanotransferase